MIQGGDPEGNGTGGPGYSIAGEFTKNGFKNDLAHTEGVLSMARSQNKDSAGSQFFIVTKDAPDLDGQYASFGKVIKGMDVVHKIENVEINGKNAMKITFSSDPDQIALKGSDLSTASWNVYSSLVLDLEKGDGNVRSKLTANIAAGLASVNTQTGVKVYWQKNATSAFDLTQGDVVVAKKNTIKRVIFGVTEPTTVYITDISLGK